MDLKLTGKVVIVTGGAKGIGTATVRVFAAEGSQVAVIDRDRESGMALVDSLGAGVQFIEADLSESEACRRAVEQTVSAFGGVDVLVNNAGFNDGLGLDTPPEEFMTSVRSNLLHVYAMTHHALPHLQTGPGCIVNLGSKVSVTGQGRTSGYAAAKGAVTRSHENGRWRWLRRASASTVCCLRNASPISMSASSGLSRIRQPPNKPSATSSHWGNG